MLSNPTVKNIIGLTNKPRHRKIVFYFVATLLISSLIVVMAVAHSFLFHSLHHFYPITVDNHYNLILTAIIFLAVSFVIFSSLAHRRENIFTRVCYFAFGLWLGILTNLILASLVIWAVIYSFSWANINKFTIAGIADFFYFLAFAFSAWGIWNAFNPRLKFISVKIPNLPEHWKGKKIVQISDLHIGHIHKNNFVKNVVFKINSVQPELVVITGDLLDGMDGDLVDPLKVLNGTRAKKGIYYIKGNHEIFLGDKYVDSKIQYTKIKAINDKVIDIDGLKLIGINHPEHGDTLDAVRVLAELKSQYFGHPNIFIYHSPDNIKKIKDLGINLQLSGHTHDAQLFPLNYVSRLIFSGHSHGLFLMDNYALYVSNGTGTWGPAMRTTGAPEIMVITLQ